MSPRDPNPFDFETAAEDWRPAASLLILVLLVYALPQLLILAAAGIFLAKRLSGTG